MALVTLTGWAPYNFQRDEAKFEAAPISRATATPKTAAAARSPIPARAPSSRRRSAEFAAM
jgi:hypothetical protein